MMPRACFKDLNFTTDRLTQYKKNSSYSTMQNSKKIIKIVLQADICMDICNTCVFTALPAKAL